MDRIYAPRENIPSTAYQSAYLESQNGGTCLYRATFVHFSKDSNKTRGDTVRKKNLVVKNFGESHNRNFGR